MREYSRRERILLGTMGIVFLATGILIAAILVTQSGMRTLGTYASAIGLFGGFVLFVKIAATGTSWRLFELRMNDPFHEQDEREPPMHTPSARTGEDSPPS